MSTKVCYGLLCALMFAAVIGVAFVSPPHDSAEDDCMWFLTECAKHRPLADCRVDACALGKCLKRGSR